MTFLICCWICVNPRPPSTKIKKVMVNLCWRWPCFELVNLVLWLLVAKNIEKQTIKPNVNICTVEGWSIVWRKNWIINKRMASSDTIQVCSLPLPPMQYVNQYTDEMIRRGRAPRPPPPIQDTYHMFGNAFNTEDSIIRPLESQVSSIRWLVNLIQFKQMLIGW